MPRLYTYNPSKETGNATSMANYYLLGGGGDQTQQLTEAQLQAEFNKESNGQLQVAFGSFDNYLAYMNERQDLIDNGSLNPAWWTDPDNVSEPYRAVITLQSGEKIPAQFYYQELGPIVSIEGIPSPTGGPVNKDNIMASEMWGHQMAQLDELFAKYATGMNSQGGSAYQHYNDDGDIFTWNGTSFVKTTKIDDTFDLNDFIGVALKMAHAAGMGYAGAIGMSSVLGISVSNAQILMSGINSAVQSGGDPKAVLGAIAGTVIGSYVGGLNFAGNIPGNAVIDSAIAGAVSSAIEQGIANGEIDLTAMINSGLLSGGVALLSDIASDIWNEYEDFDLGGFLQKPAEGETSALWDFFNADGGFVDTFRGKIDEFVTKYITGGEWFTMLDDSDEFKEYYETTDLDTGEKIIRATRWDGTKVDFSVEEFFNSTFSTNKILTANPIISAIMNSAPVETLLDWMEQVRKWMEANAGTSNENGVIITTGSGSDDGDGDGGCPSGQQDFGNGCEDPCPYDEFIGASDTNCVQPLTDQEQLCQETGQVYDDLNDICTDECKTPGYIFDAAAGKCVPASDVDADGDGVPADQDPDDNDPNVPGSGGGNGEGPIWDGNCTSPRPNAVESFDHQDAARQWDDQCAATHCPSGVAKIDANDDCSGNYTPQPEACSSGQVRPDGDINKPCVAIGSDCDNGNGTYDDQGACVPKTTGTGGCPDGSDPQYQFNDLDQDGYFQFSGQWYKYDPCNPGGGQTPVTQCSDGSFEEDAANCPAAPVPPCTDSERATNSDGSCSDKCKDDTLPSDHEGGLCSNPLTSVPTETCDNGATVESNCNECPEGQDFQPDENGVDRCVDITTTPTGEGGTCDDPNRKTNADGSCAGECKENYAADEEGVCQPITTGGECTNGAVNYPDCDTCAADAVADENGNCVPITTGTGEGGDGSGGSGSGGFGGLRGGGTGLFKPFSGGLNYQPIPVPSMIATPQKDYMTELENLIKRSMFGNKI